MNYGTDVSDSMGTLWLVQRDDHLAHCGLFWSREGWELRVHIHEYTLLAQQCKRADQVLELADAWRERLIERGWRDARPPVTATPRFDRRAVPLHPRQPRG
jgi:hypothetical protein